MKTSGIFGLVVGLVFCGLAARGESAAEILDATGVKGGLVVHIGCGDGRVTAALRASESYIVQGLDADPVNVERAREYITSLGLYGPVSVELLADERLPYIDNLVNLVVVEDSRLVRMEEVDRVLAPGGVAYVKDKSCWSKSVKAWPKEIDEWTHYLHDSSNNAVAHDSVIAPPGRLQWIGGGRWARHHDRMSSVSAVVSACGRVFYIFDEGSRFSVLLEPRWRLIARDAFNGTILWKRAMGRWHTHLWPLKSGPAQLPRRLVADGDRVYVTLSIDGPLTALDAATGRTIRSYAETKATEEVVYSNGVLFALVDSREKEPEVVNLKRLGGAYGGKFWDEAARRVVALDANSGELLWSVESRVLPVTLAVSGGGVFFHDGQSVVCLDASTGRRRWRSEPVERAREIRSFYAPTLVVYEDVVLFSGGETAGLQTGSWYTSGKDTMTALSAKTGKVLWRAYHPPSGYRSPEDLFVVNGLVWTGETTSGRALGVFTGRELHTGEVKVEFAPDIDIYWFHHRCYRGKATDNYLLTSRAGVEFVDIRRQRWSAHHWVRGACLYGIMPANGLLYNAPHPCACYLESKLFGFSALAPAGRGARVPAGAARDKRLEKGPAYGRAIEGESAEDEWPTYRHDGARSGRASTSVPESLKREWQLTIGAKISSPVVAGGKVFVAAVDRHGVYAVDAASGKELWHYTCGGRVDSAPTVYRGRVLFGSADGYVYCLDAREGSLIWRFRAAPIDQRLVSFEQVESVWPVHGSVLVRDGVVYCVAGRSMFLDGGLHVWRLEARTGKSLGHTVLDEREAATGKTLLDYVSWLNMPPALPDVLSSDGRFIYMRSQRLNLDGTRPALEEIPHGPNVDHGAPPAIQRPEYAHLFCPTGFLDDSWWHRTYWMYGSTFVSGWCGYYLAGKVAPAGRILVVDDSKVYGFGRKPEYYRWTTPLEHHLFCAEKSGGGVPGGSAGGRCCVEVERSASLNPAGKALSVEAWIKSEGSRGVIVAHGGGSHGYALYLQAGRPRFAVRVGGKVASVSSKRRLPRGWAHVVGVLSGERRLRIYVDGELAGSAESPGLIAAEPREALEIGCDEGSAVGDYRGPFAFKGLVDELVVYHRALSEEVIARNSTGVGAGGPDRGGLVLWYSFDDGKAVDRSGNGNDGKIEGASVAKGRFGDALRFTGGGGAVEGFTVRHDWTRDIPLFARAMVLAGDRLFVAGPADVVDEPSAFKRIGDADVAGHLKRQLEVIEGREGAVLQVIRAVDGGRLAEYKLDGVPVFDGMIAARGRLFISTEDGRLVCMAGR